MARPDHLEQLKAGVESWNQWRDRIRLKRPNLTDANLRRAPLAGVNLRGALLAGADLSRADLSRAELSGADLRNAKLIHVELFGTNLDDASLRRSDLRHASLYRSSLVRADLRGTNLYDADFRNADLSFANLAGVIASGANFGGANLEQADLSRADLQFARFIHAKLNHADLSGARVYGVSVWSAKGLETARQNDIVVSRAGHPVLTVDDIEVAQLIHVLIENRSLRRVIDTITSKVVLLLGRFTPPRKAVLDALRGELRTRGYVPILFDFEQPRSRNITETVSLLAHMARFVIADLTDAKSVPQELGRIVPALTTVPVQPILQDGDPGYSMFADLLAYPWVLPPFAYRDSQSLLSNIALGVISPAEDAVHRRRSI